MNSSFNGRGLEYLHSGPVDMTYSEFIIKLILEIVCYHTIISLIIYVILHTSVYLHSYSLLFIRYK